MILRLIRNSLRAFLLLPMGAAAAQTTYDLYVEGNDVFRNGDPLDGQTVPVPPGPVRLLGDPQHAPVCTGASDIRTFSLQSGTSATCQHAGKSLILRGAEGASPRAFIYSDRGLFGARRSSVVDGVGPLTLRVFTANGMATPVCEDVDKKPVAASDGRLEFTPGTFTCRLNTAAWTVEVSSPTPAAPTQPAAQPRQESRCSADVLRVDPPPTECGASGDDQVTVCVGLDGQPVGPVPILEQGRTLRVRLVAPPGAISGSLAVQFERTLLLRTFTEEVTRSSPGASQTVAEQSVRLTSAGKVTIKVSRSAGTLQIPSRGQDGAKSSTPCTVPEATPDDLVLKVVGDYYLSLGLAPIYAANKSLRTGARLDPDGVTRVYEDRGAQVDLMMNLVAYPGGVRDTSALGLGVLLGTSLANPGRSWYAGGTVAFPAAGVGLIGGVAAHVVDRLQDEIAAGRPWQTGVDVPTETGVQVGWFAGVNVEDGLFRKVFSALFSEDD